MNKVLSQALKKAVSEFNPNVADSKKEERATSTLLASFTVVPAFALEVFSQAGAFLGKRSKIKCFTEVTFKGAD